MVGMCGRFVLFSETLLDDVAALPGVCDINVPEGMPGPRYNIGPTQKVAAIRIVEGMATVLPARWGLFPHWKKDETGPPLFNARGETVASKPSFRDAFSGKVGGRCLIPLDGYYEWHDAGDGDGKYPYFVRRDDGRPLYAAGLWATGLDQLSVTMVTTASAAPLEWLHDRLPRFLADDEMTTWLEGTPEEARDLLEPAPERVREHMQATRVGKEVGNIRNDYPELIAPLEKGQVS